MNIPVNTFKQALQEGRPQIGLWLGLANAYCAEICAGADFDWLLIDSEHAPNDLQTLLAQLQAVAPYRSHPIIRVPIGDVTFIKQILDLGVQTLLVPVVETAVAAAEMVRAVHYPPVGIRGVGSALARASRWNRIGNYLHAADEQMCLLVQVETARGVDNLHAIASVEGVDGIFIGPSDLSASLGYRGQPAHAEVQKVIESSIATVLAAGKAVGILTADEALAKRYLELGCTFVAVGVDATLLASATDRLAAKYKGTAQSTPSATGPYG
jgi:4-hydroxy-2-oxoheptanedioate aldolase